MDIMKSIRMAAGRSPDAKAEPEPAKFECDTCQDEGHHMDMRCYGGRPVEVEVWCIDCGGTMAGELWEG